VASLFASASAEAAPVLVAGWDFSQYGDPGFLSTDGGNSLTNKLSANYSDLDSNNASLGTTVTGFAGLGSGTLQYGTMHLDGLYGSFNTPLDATDPIAPTNPGIALAGNVGQIAPTLGSAGALSSLISETPNSQAVAGGLGLTAGTAAAGSGPLDAVFQAILGTSLLGSNFSLSFAGQTVSGTSNLSVEFSTNGTTYAPLGVVALGTTAQAFTFAAGGTALDDAFFRFRFNGSNTIAPTIDNVTIKADVAVIPEPGTVLLLGSGLAGLAAFGRRRG